MSKLQRDSINSSPVISEMQRFSTLADITDSYSEAFRDLSAVPLLQGKSNFLRWRKCTVHILAKHDLVRYLLGTAPTPQRPDPPAKSSRASLPGTMVSKGMDEKERVTLEREEREYRDQLKAYNSSLQIFIVAKEAAYKLLRASLCSALRDESEFTEPREPSIIWKNIVRKFEPTQAQIVRTYLAFLDVKEEDYENVEEFMAEFKQRKEAVEMVTPTIYCELWTVAVWVRALEKAKRERAEHVLKRMEQNRTKISISEMQDEIERADGTLQSKENAEHGRKSRVIKSRMSSGGRVVHKASILGIKRSRRSKTIIRKRQSLVSSHGSMYGAMKNPGLVRVMA